MNICKPKKPIYHYFYLKELNSEYIEQLKKFVDECCPDYEVYEFYCKHTDTTLYSIRSDFFETGNCSLFKDSYIVHKYSFKNEEHDFFIYDSIDFDNMFEFNKEKSKENILLSISEHPVTLEKCPIGLFISKNNEGDELCLKTEYGNNAGRIDCYIVNSGEFFWGGAKTNDELRKILVYPVCEM